MADEMDAILAVAGYYGVLSMACAIEMFKKRQHRSMWTRPWIVDRPVSGAYHKLFSDLQSSDEASFRNFVRMNIPAFEDLLSRVEFKICKKQTRLRRPICARERLCLTIRYLATGTLINVEIYFIYLLYERNNFVH
jgi:hypothetical protein